MAPSKEASQMPGARHVLGNREQNKKGVLSMWVQFGEQHGSSAIQHAD